MSTPATDWSQQGRGRRHPASLWTYRTGSPLCRLDLGIESGEIAISTDDGHLHLLGTDGSLRHPPRPLDARAALDWTDVATGGVVQIGPKSAAWVDHDLEVQWSVDVHTDILDVATSPFGNAIAISLADAHTFVLDAQQQRCGEFTTSRPLQHIHFVPQRRAIVGTADSGMLCSHRLDGRERWTEQIWRNVGDLAVNGNGRTILLAAFNHGVQSFTARGRSHGFFDIEGTVHLVSISYVGTILAAATREQQLYLLDIDGSILWQATLPEPLATLRCGPLGEHIICGFSSGLVECLRWPPWPRHKVEADDD